MAPQRRPDTSARRKVGEARRQAGLTHQLYGGVGHTWASERRSGDAEDVADAVDVSAELPFVTRPQRLRTHVKAKKKRRQT
jgi:hypothetical protein